MIILYSTGCPKCNVLIKKLDAKGIEYTIESNEEQMINMGLSSIPALSVDGELMNFKAAVDWVNNK